MFLFDLLKPNMCLQVHSQELNNGVINACFLLLFKDLIKLYACYNDGIINLLGKETWLSSDPIQWSVSLLSLVDCKKCSNFFVTSFVQKNSFR